LGFGWKRKDCAVIESYNAAQERGSKGASERKPTFQDRARETLHSSFREKENIDTEGYDARPENVMTRAVTEKIESRVCSIPFVTDIQSGNQVRAS